MTLDELYLVWRIAYRDDRERRGWKFEEEAEDVMEDKAEKITHDKALLKAFKKIGK